MPRLKPRAGFVSTCLLIFRYSLNYRKIEPFIFLDFVAIVFFPFLHRLFFASCPFPPARRRDTLYLRFSPIVSRFVNSFTPSKTAHSAVTLSYNSLFLSFSSRLPYSFTAANFRLIARREGKKRNKERERERRGLEKGRRCATLASNRFFFTFIFQMGNARITMSFDCGKPYDVSHIAN